MFIKFSTNAEPKPMLNDVRNHLFCYIFYINKNPIYRIASRSNVWFVDVITRIGLAPSGFNWSLAPNFHENLINDGDMKRHGKHAFFMGECESQALDR